MRLIDADKIVNYRITADDGRKYILLPVEKLSDIPTAYDVDKVIEELKVKSMMFVDPWVSYEFQKWAIDIVKRGGIE